MTSSEISSKNPPIPPLDWVRETGKVDLVLQDIESKLRKRSRRRTRAGGVAAVLVVATLTAFWAVPYARDTNTINSPVGRRSTIALADGSSAELNARTQLHTDFRYGRRTVRLDQGEAFFSVTKDPPHPFLVETPAGTVRVTGTQFNVRLKDDGAAEVTLLEGKVDFVSQLSTFNSQLSTGGVHLVPGQQLDSSNTAPRTLAPDALAATTAWREGRLVLDGLTLGEAAARFAAYHGREIVVAPEVAGFRMGGSCSLDDLPGFLEFLPKAVSVQVLSHGEGSIRIIAR